jgi:hypothetical protein
MFIFLEFSLNTSRAIKKEGVKLKFKNLANMKRSWFKIKKNGLISNGIRHIVFGFLSFDVFSLDPNPLAMHH